MTECLKAAVPRDEKIRCVAQVGRRFGFEAVTKLLDYPNRCRAGPCFSVGALRLALDAGFAVPDEWDLFAKVVQALEVCGVLRVVGSLAGPGEPAVINYNVDAYEFRCRNTGTVARPGRSGNADGKGGRGGHVPEKVRSSGSGGGGRGGWVRQSRITDFT